ncbi:ROK family protein [Rhodobacterales bacterium HKCCE3408]|nr:ROK family protein [Rhodobacterales bacterium HKCCE3408]
MTELCGGIDLGGTKIEARLFSGPDAETTDIRRIPTPTDAFAPMIDAVADQLDWLTGQAGAIPVGLSVAGLIDPVTGESFASNLPTTGHAIAPAIAERTGLTVPVVNDTMAFTYSEAHGGAGEGAEVVMGLILGTGVGGGICIGGQLPHRHAGLSVEVGHLGVSNRALARHGLPLWPCGCGRMGCVENYVSGTGLTNLAEWRMGRRLSAEELEASTDPRAAEVMEIWSDLAGDCLHAIQIMLDPDCIVLGGGLSKMPGIAERMTEALERNRLGRARLPRIVTARHGDSSGARGAALLARAASC